MGGVENADNLGGQASKRSVLRKLEDNAAAALFTSGRYSAASDISSAIFDGLATAAKSVKRYAGKLAIGVDANQNHIHPGTMLTSMLKRVDVAAYNSYKAAQDGTWKGGIHVLGHRDDKCQ